MTVTSAILTLHGIHAWNVATRDYRRDPASAQPDGEAAAFMDLICNAGARRVKFLYPDQGRHEAEIATAQGLDVLFRAPGEGAVHYEVVIEMIQRLGHRAAHDNVPEQANVCKIIEVGNETLTDPDSLWQHAQYLEWVYLHCAALAEYAGITLCTPGWRNGLSLPTKESLIAEYHLPADQAGALADRLRNVYTLYDMNALHVYEVHRLVATWRQPNKPRPAEAPIDAIDRISSWFADLDRWDKSHAGEGKKRRYIVTEYGIAARLLAGFTDKAASDVEKAHRYYTFLSALALYTPYVEGAYAFILGGTAGFERFNNGGDYNAAGDSSYWLTREAWAELKRQVEF